MKNLLVLRVIKDFGTDYTLQFLNIRGRSLLQVSISWSDYAGFIYLQITAGSSGLLGFIFWLGRFGIDFSVLSRTYDFDYFKSADEG